MAELTKQRLHHRHSLGNFNPSSLRKLRSLQKLILSSSSTSKGDDFYLEFNMARTVLFWGIFMKIRIIAGLVAGLAFLSPASATQVFFQNFEGLTPDAPYTAPLPGFTVSGTIDVVGVGNPYTIVTSSNIVDLDGSPGPGTITSSTSYAFNAGDRVTLSFLLGGAQRGSPSDNFTLGWLLSSAMTVTDIVGTGHFGSLNIASAFAPTSGSASITLAGDAGFLLSSVSFIATAAGTFGFSLGTTSADSIGPLVDNIGLDISAVPGPVMGAGLPGLVIALGVLVALRRRRMFAA
jgi:hypothetical protein